MTSLTIPPYNTDLDAWRARIEAERAALGALPQPCVECGTEFVPYSSQSRLCSAACRKRRHNRQKIERERARRIEL